MQIVNKSLVVVADGRKMLFFRNQGDEVYPNLEIDRVREQENPYDRDQKSDAAGAASSTQSGPGAPPAAQGGSMHASGGGAQFAPSRGTMGETDYHQMEEDRFAAETAELLKKRALANDFESLIIVAPPKTLGELRKHYHKEVESRLVGEIAKDLTGHPVDEIEKIIASA
jgi:protein required for attachment to host cells